MPNSCRRDAFSQWSLFAAGQEHPRSPPKEDSVVVGFSWGDPQSSPWLSILSHGRSSNDCPIWGNLLPWNPHLFPSDIPIAVNVMILEKFPLQKKKKKWWNSWSQPWSSQSRHDTLAHFAPPWSNRPSNVLRTWTTVRKGVFRRCWGQSHAHVARKNSENPLELDWIGGTVSTCAQGWF